MKAKYINPFTDFGFKKIFGEEASKPLLIDFLNALLPLINKIKDLSFKNTEQLGQTTSRKAIYDIYCENGEKFIVELQKAKQNYFKERTIYYSTFPIREQAEKGEWKGPTPRYNLNTIFCVGILDFTFDDYENEPERSEVVHTIKLKNQNGKTFYDKLTYIYLEMPNFNQTEDELTTRLDKWLFFIKYFEDFQNIPAIFKDKIFTQAFEKAEIAKFGQAELDSYENSLKYYRDIKGAIDTAFDDGKIEGKIEIAKKLKVRGLSTEDIAEVTGLSEDEIEKL
ncbi:Rpn family recombination-promoting nuclease/putative transposase [Runella sp.]|jgi:predicted transposase/invertase (TIGR01784 family)|uniref:Rpn family recombination-promoting nuclease/putative transposase n=1 Tax=Runella sp. TaxID=1960881 RepID=UPI002611AD2E|nr:Rpn family recombination-promoting nuclease/putative transposase [Runella sp.]